jgi:Flp pilus assembly protein TadD
MGRLGEAERELHLGAGGDRTKRILPDELTAEAEALAVGRVTRLVALRAHMGAQRWTEALAEADALLVHYPDEERVLIDRAIALVSLGRREEARASLEHLESVHPDSYHLRMNYTQFLLEEGNTQEAMRNARLAVELAPDEASAHALLGRVFQESGKPKRARNSYLRAHELEPESVRYLELAARVDLELRDYAGARERFEQLVALQPESDVAWLRLAEASYGAGDPAAARRALASAVSHGASKAAVAKLAALLGEVER